MDLEMSVIKRSGSKEIISFDKILKRVKNLGENTLKINYTMLAMKIIDRLYDNIPTAQIDELTAEQCASLSTTHPDYGILASRILISNHHKNTNADYATVISNLYTHKDIHNKPCPLVNKELHSVVIAHKDEIQNIFISP